MYLECDQAFEEDLYRRVRESLLSSKSFRRGDHDMRVHLVCDCCEKCDNLEDCEDYFYFHSMRFDAIYEFIELAFKDKVDESEDNLVPHMCVNYEDFEMENTVSSPIENLFDKMMYRIDRDIKLYDEIYAGLYEPGSDGEKMINSLKFLFCD